jgi:hypothetical protein
VDVRARTLECTPEPVGAKARGACATREGTVRGPVRVSNEDNPMNPNQRHEPGSLDSFPWRALARISERSSYVVDVRVDGVALDEQAREQLLDPLRRGLAAFAADIESAEIEIIRVGTTREWWGKLFRVMVTLHHGGVVHAVAFDSRLLGGLARAVERVARRIDIALCRRSW